MGIYFEYFADKTFGTLITVSLTGGGQRTDSLSTEI